MSEWAMVTLLAALITAAGVVWASRRKKDSGGAAATSNVTVHVPVNVAVNGVPSAPAIEMVRADDKTVAASGGLSHKEIAAAITSA